MAAHLVDHRGFLATYLRPQRWRVVVLAALLLTSIGLQLANPQILRRFIDAATQGGSDRMLTTAAILFIAIALVQQVLAVGATYLSENVGWAATNALRADLLLHCLRLDQTFHKTRTPGELIERIDGDVTALANLFSQFVVQVLGNLLLLVGVLLVLWNVDWRIGVLQTVIAALVLWTLARIQAWVMPRWKVARQAGAELYGFIEERLAGTEDIRSSGAQAYTMRRLYERMTNQFRAERTARLMGRSVWVSSHLYFALGTAAIFILGAHLFRTSGTTVGTLYIVFFYNSLLIHPLVQITRQVEDLQRASAGMARVRELLETRSTLADGPGAAIPAGALPVRFDQVSFAYEDGEPVIRDLTLDLRPGSVVGVLGRTGSGKTTLTRLLQRLYDPLSGKILLGGVDIRMAKIEELRRRVGIVTQEVQLFHATVRENLTLFDDTISDVQILHAIEELGLSPWYDALPAGLETTLAAGHGGLSAGEAQLLAFTRIFLRDPGLVILDEASSRLDPATEQLIERAVDKLLHPAHGRRTGIIIAHRLHTVQRADDILILERGAVVEYGPREDLMADPDSRFTALLRTGLEEALV